MSTPLGVRSATRRYVALTALRWLPVGVTIPVTVLLALWRGLTLAQVGRPRRPSGRYSSKSTRCWVQNMPL